MVWNKIVLISAKSRGQRALSGQRDTVNLGRLVSSRGLRRAFSRARGCELLQGGAASLSTEAQPGCVEGQWVSDLVLAVTGSITSVLLRGILHLTSAETGSRISFLSIHSCFTENVAKIKHDEEFVSKGLIFWMG